MERSITGTVNLHKYTIKDSNNLSIVIFKAYFEFCINLVDHVWWGNVGTELIIYMM